MSIFEQWKKQADKANQQNKYDEYWESYFKKEKKNYEYILVNHNEIISGKLSEVAGKFDMDSVTMTGFLDGINTSLVNAIELSELTEDSEVELEIDFEKLYYNMLNAKADWLYNLTEWEGILSKERRSEITKEYNRTKIAVRSKVGRNDPCPCGSGRKYKKCCGSN